MLSGIYDSWGCPVMDPSVSLITQHIVWFEARVVHKQIARFDLRNRKYCHQNAAKIYFL